MVNQERLTIVGAGLAGPLLATYLSRRGFPCDLYEQRPDIRTNAMVAGRSINLALSIRGIHALEQVGLAEIVLRNSIKMRGRLIHPVSGNCEFVPYNSDGESGIYSTSRGELNKILLSAAEENSNVAISFNQRLLDCDLQGKQLTFWDEAVQTRIARKYDRVIGTDGAGSPLRSAMIKAPRCNYSQQFLEHSYKELSIQPTKDGTFALEPNALHIWPRGSFMLIALPNLDKTFTCTLFYPHSGPESFETLTTPESVQIFFKKQFPDALALMPQLVEEFFANPIGNLATVRCAPWAYKDEALLLGDAAHAIVPFFGQGMNCAFEDCAVFDTLVQSHRSDWIKIFREFETLRKRNADAIADLALENFVEMRDLMADEAFRTRRKVEHILEQRFPERFLSRYSMVTFTRLPYAEAKARGDQQEGILKTLCSGISHYQEVDLDRAAILLKELSPLEQDA